MSFYHVSNGQMKLFSFKNLTVLKVFKSFFCRRHSHNAAYKRKHAMNDNLYLTEIAWVTINLDGGSKLFLSHV